MITPRQSGGYAVATIRRPAKGKALQFLPLTTDGIPSLRPLLKDTLCRTCDFTIGGTFMWIDYFDYSYCIYDDTLFIKGVTEDDVSRPAFSVPVGKMRLEDSVAILKDYCRLNDCELIFSAVPEPYIAPLRALGAKKVEALEDWSDYLYDARALATLSGKKLSKKRNHVNRFMADNPGYSFEALTAESLPAVRQFFHATHLPLSKPALADVEREQVSCVLDNPWLYGFEGAVLSTPDHGIVAFTLGEIKGDTPYVHIEKMNHEIAGAGETVNKLFAELITESHPEVIYINREEDVGDPGLRHAKESYHPIEMLHKFNVSF